MLHAGAGSGNFPVNRSAAYSLAYNRATGTTEPYRGTDHTVRRMIELARGDRGERSIKVRRHTEQIIGQLRPKDYSSEVIAIYRWWCNAGRYTRDPLHTEMLRDPERMVDDALVGKLAMDCFPEGTLLLRDDYRLVPVEAIEPGQRIWGDRDWSTVEAAMPKGRLTVDALRLNTGSWLRLTGDHLVYVVLPSGGVERVRVADVEPGMALLSPDRIAFGEGGDDPDLHYLDGLYLSDGWKEPYGIAISGQDGCPKEQQKREAQAIAERYGWNAGWRRKSLYIGGHAILERVDGMGRLAPEKRATNLNLGEEQAAALLRGIMADSGLNTNARSRTFSSTSRELAVQVRVLHKMFGIRMSMRRVDDHGGLGLNPIYRLGQRIHPRWHATRVTEVIRDVDEADCWDITTSDHKVYLPAHDVTVSNCDEFGLAIGTGCLTVGARVQFVTVGFEPPVAGTPKMHTHVFCRAQDPRTKTWWVLDPVAGRNTGRMLQRVKQYTAFEV